jgi:hypothetical protein
MIDGLILGIITWFSFCLTFVHLPAQLQKLLLKYPMATDGLAAIGSFFLLTEVSKSIVAAVASMICGVLVSLSLIIYEQIH